MSPRMAGYNAPVQGFSAGHSLVTYTASLPVIGSGVCVREGCPAEYRGFSRFRFQRIAAVDLAQHVP